MSVNYLKRFLRGLGILMLLITAAPGTTSAAPAARYASAAAFAQLDLTPNIETIGVVVSGASLPATAQLLFRQSSDPTWHPAHPLMLISDGRLVGSLFGLIPATAYNIKVTDGTTEITGSTTTQPDATSVHAPADYSCEVPAQPPGGDGSAAAPFQHDPGGRKSCRRRVHRCWWPTACITRRSYSLPREPRASGYRSRRRAAGAILDGSAKSYRGTSGRCWTGERVSYFTKIAAPIAYLARDQKRFYAYDNITGLNQGLGHNGVAMSEGWFFEAST